LLFQTLDDKTECVGIYANQQLIFDLEVFPPGLTKTWKYSPYLRDFDVDYVSLYLEGTSIKGSIPEYLQDDWDDVCQKIVAFKRSLSISQVNTYENCFFDLVPERFLVEFCEIKNKITEYISNNIKRPERYQFYKHVSMLLEDIGHQNVKIDKQTVSSYLQHSKLKNHARNIMQAAPTVKYNQFGTKTGRLTTKKGSVPILTMSKELRSAVHPQNDCFVELDFNGAEVRTLLGLLGKDQPPGDVHDFHLNEIFTKINTRDQAKVAFFAWLYGSRTAADAEEMKKLADYYKKDQLLQKYWDGDTVRTPFKKVISDASEHHALNYLVQSTAAELTLKQAVKLEYLLRTQSQGSRIAFLIHDAVVIDMKNEDANLLKSMVALMGSTNFGKFLVNIKRGKTLGSMKDIQLG
jgi:DNA polymerase I-like protein with 3'-5' exonuclease and polymerase domains